MMRCLVDRRQRSENPQNRVRLAAIVNPARGVLRIHFFSRKKVEQLAHGFEILSIDEFEESALPGKLFWVTLRRKIS